MDAFFSPRKSRRDVPDPRPDSCILILWREGGTGKFLTGKTHHVGEEHEYKGANMWLWAQCQRPSAWSFILSPSVRSLSWAFAVYWSQVRVFSLIHAYNYNSLFFRVCSKLTWAFGWTELTFDLITISVQWKSQTARLSRGDVLVQKHNRVSEVNWRRS